VRTFADGLDGHDRTVITWLWACLRLPGQVLGIIADALGAGTERARPAPLSRPRLELVHRGPMQSEPAEDELVHDEPPEPASVSTTEKVAFSLDGTSYEIDLPPEEAAALRGELNRFVAAARRSPRRSGTSRPATAAMSRLR